MKKSTQKFISGIVSLSLLSGMLVTNAFAMEPAAEEVLQENNFTVIVESENAEIASEVNTLSRQTFENVSTDGNLLFEAAAFDSALEKPEKVRSLILNGNVIAVFSKDGEDRAYEETMGLPLGFEESGSSNENGITVGHVYRTDALGKLHIARVRMDPELVDSSSQFDEFMKIVNQFMLRDSSIDIKSRGSSAEMEFIGSISDYYRGSDKKGNIDVTYEVSTAQAIDGYDYYAVHAFIDYTPGGALYNNGYDVDAFSASLSSSSSGSNLYKTGPDTMTGVTTYSVDIGFTGSVDGAEVSYGAGWSRDIPDVTISKVKNSSTKCTWNVDVDDWAKPADNTISFEPGGTFRVKSSNNKLSVLGQNSLTVDNATSLPSTAVSGSTRFYCTANGVEE